VISGVGKVVLPVEDQEQAKQFWTTRVGFEATRDETYGDERCADMEATHRELTERGTRRALGQWT
jgi:catechol-2,3-dioxygenase